jgi:hypothetical protein
VHSVYDLVNARHPYPTAIPVLLALLPRVQHPRIKEGIARALTVREARPVAAQPLFAAFVASQPQSTSEEHAKWALANALAVVADDALYAQVVAVLRDRTHGWTRSGMVAALAHMPQHRHEAVDVLCALLDDADVAPQALITLGQLRDPRARGAIEPFCRHPDAWVRQQAQRAVAKMEKAGTPSEP